MIKSDSFIVIRHFIVVFQNLEIWNNNYTNSPYLLASDLTFSLERQIGFFKRPKKVII